ncbi:MAG TPA: hypothetical protein VJ951_02075, partial [Bacteroidales bacterium]|nr:hypothetical protein [Bacteroidales bacterium]
MPLIEVDPGAGFCFGVEKAIEQAESLLKRGEKVFSLGYLVHNSVEVERLKNAGLGVVKREELDGLKNAKLLFRAHGEPPSSYRMVKDYGISLIDATCPIVIKLQKRIKKKYVEMDPAKEQIVIFGKERHPETIGLLGQTENNAVLITDPDDLSAIQNEKKVFLYSQTTMDPDQFVKLETNLKRKFDLQKVGKVASHCTICGQMKRRKPDLKKFIS